MRSASVQFGFMSREEAKRFLDSCPKTIDSVGDRIAAARRLEPVTTAVERATSHAYNKRREREIAKYGSVEAFRAALALQAKGVS